MQLENSAVLITGANLGIGFAFANAFLQRGPRKIYAGARDPSKVRLPDVTPVQLDVHSAADDEASCETI